MTEPKYLLVVYKSKDLIVPAQSTETLLSLDHDLREQYSRALRTLADEIDPTV